MIQRAAQFWSGAGVVGITLAVGAGAFVSPWLPAGVAFGILALSLGIRFASELPRVFIGALGILLVGYWFMERGFAYIGVPPVFVGEMTLGLGVLAAMVTRGFAPLRSLPVVWVLLAFGAWGAARTLPYIGTYGVDALRDGAIWGYALFALLVARFLPEVQSLPRVLARYAQVLPWFLAFLPVSALLNLFAEARLPRLWSDAPIPSFKPGDAAVHLAGAGAFLLLGLHRWARRETMSKSVLSDTVVWLLWLIGLLIVGALSRGGTLAVLAAFLIVLLLGPIRASRRLVHLGVLGISLAIGLLAFDFTVDRGTERAISAAQIAQNLGSVAGGSEADVALGGSRTWRLEWWEAIEDYTFHGPYFWTGKGFGINIGSDDGFGLVDESLRSPHNIHITILARAGVPGLVLWLALQGTFVLSMLVTFHRARRQGDECVALAIAWLLAYYSAFLVNGTFDVFLEGPQGGIWFWCLVGLGLAIMRQAESRSRRGGAAVAYGQSPPGIGRLGWRPQRVGTEPGR